MPAIKTSAARILAGFAVSAFITPFCFAATLSLNKEDPLDISTSPGFSYVVQGSSGSLSVPTDGFLFCANVYPATPPDPSAVTVIPQHGNWRFPFAQDVVSVAYNASVLRVNAGQQTTLVCHSVGSEGEVRTGLTDGVFRNSYESKTIEQFSNFINWIPSQGFDWNAPDWAQVPTDPCFSSLAQPAQVVEDVACAGATGARSAGAGATVRAPTLWTGTDGVNFFYVARIDGRSGAQGAAPEGPTFPMSLPGGQPEGSGGATLNIIDAYSRGVVGVGGGYLGDTGTWCYLPDLPTVLDGNVCVGAPFSDTLNGPVNYRIDLSVATSLHTSFYMAFIRPIVGPPPSVSEPAVAVSILVEPSVVAVGGDKFKGDDVAFGFLPASQGFPWMTGGQ
jgi:hypothetical protein